MNITVDHPEYIERLNELGKARFNGCYYYSKEIEEIIIPRVKTDRQWNIVGRDVSDMCDGMIVVLHDNSRPFNYQWLKKYKDLILVVSSDYTARSVIYSGRIIFLPMSVDTEYVKQFKQPKTKEICFFGNPWVLDNTNEELDEETDFLPSGLPREQMLKEVAKYKKAYCIDRCAIEASVLGCEVMRMETRYSVDNVGAVLDSRSAAKIIQASLDYIDKGARMAEYRSIKQGRAFVVQQRTHENGKWETLGEFDDEVHANKMVQDLNRQY